MSRNKQIRYELIREAGILPEIAHDSVGGVIMRHLEHAPAIATSTQSFIIPWWETIKYNDIRLGWAKVRTYPGSEEREMYFVERRKVEPLFVVRKTVLDYRGIYPLKSIATCVATDLVRRDALAAKELLQLQYGDEYFFDIYPQDL